MNLKYIKTKISYDDLKIDDTNFCHGTNMLWAAANQNIIQGLKDFPVKKEIDGKTYIMFYKSKYKDKNCRHVPCLEKGKGCLFVGSISVYYRVKNEGILRISDHWNYAITKNGKVFKSEKCKSIKKCGLNNWFVTDIPENYEKNELLGGFHKYEDCVDRGQEIVGENCYLDHICGKWKLTINYEANVNTIKKELNNKINKYIKKYRNFIANIVDEKVKIEIMDKFRKTNRLCKEYKFSESL